MLFVRMRRRKVNFCGSRSVCLFLVNEKKRVQTEYKVICCFTEHYCGCEEVSLYCHVKVKIKQSRYRPGVAQRVPGS